MVYYKVEMKHDNKHKNPSKRDGNIYVGNELYTEREVIKQKLNLGYLTKIEVSKKMIYWLFGARFKVENIVRRTV